MAEREIVLLSGMHRSGTSALARVFNLLGAQLPEPLVPPALGNELGHWEPAEAVAMNDAALLAAGSDVNSLHPLSQAWLRDGGAEAFTEALRAWLERVAPPGVLTVVKDPRIAVLAPFWRAAVERLGARPRFVVNWRDPWEVSRSLARRQLEHFPDEVWPHARVELLWLKHQLELEQASRGALRSFTAYASLLEDWPAVVTRLFAELDLASPALHVDQRAAVDAFLRPGARRERRPPAEAAAGAVGEVLKLLEQRVGRPDGGAQAFDRASARLDGAVRLMGGYLGALETRVATDVALFGEAADTRALIDALRETALGAEVRAAELLRSTRVEEPPASLDALQLDDLRNRHAGLRQAYAQATAELRDAQDDLAAQGDTHASEVEAIRESARETERQLRDQAEDTERQLRDQAEDTGRQLRARTMEAERQLRVQATKTQNAESELERMRGDLRALGGERDRLDAELDDHRSAYEALRLEAAAARSQIASRDGSGSVDALSTPARTRTMGALRAEVAALHAEIAQLRASTSWRLTRPVRSVAFRVRRLVRR